MDPLRICWGRPRVLYRAFKDEKYAQLFLEGKEILLRNVREFAVTDDLSTKDQEEGRIQWRVEPGGQTVSGGAAVSIYPIYILCLSGPDIDLDYLRRQYGRYVIRINKPAQFVRDLALVLGTPQMIDCVKVTYASPPEVPEPKTRAERIQLIYSCKPQGFADDNEYRIAVVASELGGGCLGYTVNMKTTPHYMEMM